MLSLAYGRSSKVFKNLMEFSLQGRNEVQFVVVWEPGV